MIQQLLELPSTALLRSCHILNDHHHLRKKKKKKILPHHLNQLNIWLWRGHCNTSILGWLSHCKVSGSSPLSHSADSWCAVFQLTGCGWWCCPLSPNIFTLVLPVQKTLLKKSFFLTWLYFWLCEKKCSVSYTDFTWYDSTGIFGDAF